MMGTKEMPPLFAMALRYRSGDSVKTPFGPGSVRSDSKTHVEVVLASGAVLYSKVGRTVPVVIYFTCFSYTEPR